MMKKKMKTKAGILIIGIAWIAFISTCNKRYNNISNKLDVIIENGEKGKIDSLYQEIMDIGWKYDSLILKYEHGWEFTN